MGEDDRIDYIKDSLDKLHDKVDTLHESVDVRLKFLEQDNAHQKGFAKALYIVCGVIGAMISYVTTYYSGKN